MEVVQQPFAEELDKHDLPIGCLSMVLMMPDIWTIQPLDQCIVDTSAACSPAERERALSPGCNAVPSRD